jgi:hypothetical protein
LFRLKCAPDLLLAALYPNAKEWTESAAAYNACLRLLPHVEPNDPTVTVVAVADGRQPRTAAMCAFRSRWDCYSVDPNLNADKDWSMLQRVHVVKSRVEDWALTAPGHVLIIAVHPHVGIRPMLESVHAGLGYKRSVVAMPCCVKLKAGIPPWREHRDWGVLSGHNRILVWQDIPQDEQA